MSKYPCYKCAERHIGCHGVCEKYKAKSDAETAKKKFIKAKKDKDEIYVNYVCETFIKNRWNESKQRKMKEK